jgi:hypothetical protein
MYFASDIVGLLDCRFEANVYCIKYVLGIKSTLHPRLGCVCKKIFLCSTNTTIV